MAMTERNYPLTHGDKVLVGAVYVRISELARCCDVEVELVDRLVTLGLMDPVGCSADHEILFEAGAVPLLRKILRLRYDLDINFTGIGVVLELMDRMEQMEARIRELEALLFP